MSTVVDFDARTLTVGAYSLALDPATCDGGAVHVSGRVVTAGGARGAEAMQVWAGGVLLAGIGQDPAVRADWVTTVDPATGAVTSDFRVAAPLAAVGLPPGDYELEAALYVHILPPEGPDEVAEVARAATALAVPGRAAVPRLPAGGFVRALFNTPADALTPADAAAFVAAGVTHCTTGVFSNPADTGHDPDQWRAYSIGRLRAALEFYGAHGLRVLATGDDFFRTPAERDWLATAPWAEAAVKETAAVLREYGTCDCLEAFDESPGDPASHPAFGLFVRWWREAGGPPIGWPASGLDPRPGLFETPAWSDYASRFVAWGEWRNGRRASLSLPQFSGSSARAGLAADRSRPLLVQLTAQGPFYSSPGPNPNGAYRPGVDRLRQGGVAAQDVIAQLWLAVCHGACGFRVYSFDWPEWVAQRAAGTTGGDEILQTGTRPGDARWAGLAAAFASHKAREAVLAGGPWLAPVVTPAWTVGGVGPLLVAVNTVDGPQAWPGGGVLVTPAGESPHAPGAVVPAGGVVLSA